MAFVVQTQVLLPNRPGELEKLCRVLAEAEVNIHAVMVRDDVAVSAVRLVLDKPRVGRQVLTHGKFAVTESELLAVLCSDEPGELWKVSAILAENHANIQYSYSAARAVSGKAVVLFAVGGIPPDRAVQILRERGYVCIDHADLVAGRTRSP